MSRISRAVQFVPQGLRDTFFASSIPIVTMSVMDFPFQQTSELMRDRTSHRGTWMPYCATVRSTRDGEVPFIR